MTTTGGDVPIDDVPDDAAAASGTSRLAAVVWLAATGPAAIGVSLLVSEPGEAQASFGFPGFQALLALIFGSVGAVISSRRPGNRIGAILSAVGVLSGLLMLSGQYARVGLLVNPGSLPGAVWAAWLSGWLWIPQVILSGPLFLLLYPDGRLPSPRWRWVARTTATIGLLSTAGIALTVGPIESFPGLDNPVGLLRPGPIDVLVLALNLGLLAVILASVASLIVRFRASEHEARLQLKWLAVAAVVLGVTLPLGPVAGKVGEVAVIFGLCGIPLATAVAVLRYGLYEIDTIINRALVYGLLTALLAGLYAASVSLMQRVSHAATGADSDAAIILTTLLIVTAFTPIKARLQALVDHRFKEVRDPRALLQAFTAELQGRLSPLDRERVLRRLLAVVLEAIDSGAGEVEHVGPGGSMVATQGAVPSIDAALLLSASADGSTLRLTLAPPHSRRILSVRDRLAICAMLDVVARELTVPA